MLKPFSLELQDAIQTGNWETVVDLLSHLPVRLPANGNLRDIQEFLEMTQSTIDILNQSLDPSISYESVSMTIDKLLRSNLPDYINNILKYGGDMPLILDRISMLVINLCNASKARTSRSKIGQSGAVCELARRYCQNPFSVSLTDALTVLACGHMDNAASQVTNGVVTAALSVIAKPPPYSISTLEKALRLLGTISIYAPENSSPDRETLVPTVVCVLREATKSRMYKVIEHSLTVLANAADCVLREGRGYAFQDAHEVAEASYNAWYSSRGIRTIPSKAAWTLVALIHIDNSALNFVIAHAEQINPLLDFKKNVYDTQAFLKSIMLKRRATIKVASSRSKFSRFKPRSRKNSLTDAARGSLSGSLESSFPDSTAIKIVRSREDENEAETEIPSTGPCTPETGDLNGSFEETKVRGVCSNDPGPLGMHLQNRNTSIDFGQLYDASSIESGHFGSHMERSTGPTLSGETTADDVHRGQTRRSQRLRGKTAGSPYGANSWKEVCASVAKDQMPVTCIRGGGSCCPFQPYSGSSSQSVGPFQVMKPQTWSEEASGETKPGPLDNTGGGQGHGVSLVNSTNNSTKPEVQIGPALFEVSYDKCDDDGNEVEWELGCDDEGEELALLSEENPIYYDDDTQGSLAISGSDSNDLDSDSLAMSSTSRRAISAVGNLKRVLAERQDYAGPCKRRRNNATS